ncbi:MAG TPA: hypothetical protein VNX23_25965 [Bradyrhizobium sp.]|jgi:hypothetical protein|uniref:hypothetical protein n=1 Tax=Bradyrhizobium sp. TaxID=376 RepID=UPI002C18D5FE|nr:hypothetical protein [Bradyrhizobium sp.]HXB80812.1 hypothetical protein [Bradyrhizobium sp.]
MTDDIGPGWLDDLRERSWTNYCGRMAKREITSPASTKKEPEQVEAFHSKAH